VPAVGVPAAVLEAAGVGALTGGDLAPVLEPVGGGQLVRGGRERRCDEAERSSATTMADRNMYPSSDDSLVIRSRPVRAGNA
jgi:hypothetical protein